MGVAGGLLALIALGIATAISSYKTKKQCRDYDEEKKRRMQKGRNRAAEYLLANRYYARLDPIVDKEMQELKAKLKKKKKYYNDPLEPFHMAYESVNKKWFGEFGNLEDFCLAKARFKLVAMRYVPSNYRYCPPVAYFNPHSTYSMGEAKIGRPDGKIDWNKVERLKRDDNTSYLSD